MKLFVVMLLLALLLLAGCAMLRHLGGEHSPPTIKEIAAEVVKVVEVIQGDIAAMIVQKSWWLIPGCLLGLGAAAFLLVMKQVKLAIGLAAAFGTTLILSITVFKHFALIGYIVLAIGALIVGYALWQAWLYREGFSQLFRTGEATKPELDEVGKARIFGADDDDHGLAGSIQSKATERLVLLERQKTCSTNETHESLPP